MGEPSSVTVDRVTEAARREMFGTDNPGFCIACGEEAEGCELDARNYTCDSCGARKVFGASELLLMIAA